MTLHLDRPQTPAEAKLREWVEAQAGGVSFARVHGALHGVIATAQASPDLERSALRLLRVEAPEEVHALAAQAARELHALMPEEGVTPDDEEAASKVTLPRLTEQEDFLEWMGGLGAVGLSDPAPFRTILEARRTLEQDRRASRGRGQDGDEEIKNAAGDVVFLLALTPGEYLADEFSAEACARFLQLRGEFFAREGWDEAAYEQAMLNALGGVHMAWAVEQVLSQPDLLERLSLEGWGEEAPPQPIRRAGRKIRPNEPCPCGSGKKYKKCHGAPGAPGLVG